MPKRIAHAALLVFGILSARTALAGTCAGKVPDDSRTPPAAAAASDSITLNPAPVVIDEVVVTATRTPKTLKNVPVVTRLITLDEIKKADAANIQDLLTEELPGLEFGFAMGGETSLTMNGFGGNSVLFLVDGERLAGETLDNVDYNRLNLGNVGRVEIVKGASSALYGANAVGGVVNLITREPAEPWTLRLNSHWRSAGNELRNGGEWAVNSGKIKANTSVQYRTARTIRLTDAFDTESRIHEVSGGTTLNANERLLYRISDKLRFIARGGCFFRTSERGNYDDRYRDCSGGLKAEWQPDPTRSLELSYSYDQYDKARYVGSERTHDHDYSNRQHIVHGLFTLSRGAHALTAGADCMYDYLTTYQFTDNAAHAQTSADVFVQFDCNPLAWLNVVASLRDDWFSASRSNAVTGRLAAMFKLRPFSVRASYAGGFRAPTLKEMYMCFDMAGIQMIYGNPDLKPEKSHNLNLSVERGGQIRTSPLAGSYNITLSGFHSRYDNRITTADFAGDAGREAGAVYANEAGVRIMGLDASFRYRASAGAGVSLSYNYLHTAGNTIDSQFSQPRPHSATWRVDYDRQIGKSYGIYGAVSGRYLSKPTSRYETDGAYSIWKFTLQQRIGRGIGLHFIIDNLFGYRPKIYYWNSAPTVGRTYAVGASIQLNEMF